MAGRIVCRISPKRFEGAKRIVGPELHVAQNDAAALSAIRTGEVDRVAWEVSLSMPVLETSLPEEVVEAVCRIPVLLIVDASAQGIRAVAELATRVTHLQVALIGTDHLAGELTALASDRPSRGAEQAIVQRIPHGISQAARAVVVLAAIAAKRRLTVHDFAAICGLSVGAVAYRLRRGGLSPPHSLTGLFLTLHTVWRLDVLGWTSKHAAIQGGFHSPAALANYIRRHTGRTPGELTSQLGFVRLASSMESLLSAADDHELYHRLAAQPRVEEPTPRVTPLIRT